MVVVVLPLVWVVDVICASMSPSVSEVVGEMEEAVEPAQSIPLWMFDNRGLQPDDEAQDEGVATLPSRVKRCLLSFSLFCRLIEGVTDLKMEEKPLVCEKVLISKTRPKIAPKFTQRNGVKQLGQIVKGTATGRPPLPQNLFQKSIVRRLNAQQFTNQIAANATIDKLLFIVCLLLIVVMVTMRSLFFGFNVKCFFIS